MHAVNVVVGAADWRDGCVGRDAEAGRAGTRRVARGIAAPGLLENDGIGTASVVGRDGSPEGGAVCVVNGGKAAHVDRVAGAVGHWQAG